MAHDLADQNRPAAPAFRLRRVALACGALLAALNIWTGAPLLALWVGSRAVGHSGLSMGAVALVVVVLGACVLGLSAALAWLSDRYDDVIGRPAAARRTSPWLRSMRGEREELVRNRHPTTAVERAVILSIVACVVALEVWFFFFAGASMPRG